jgi:hypothetical protein
MNINLHKTDDKAVNQFARSLMDVRTQSASFEGASQRLVETLYQSLRQANGQPTFALLRVYRLMRHAELLPELQALVDPARERWMALMGTVGIEPAWGDRRLSQGHKVLNLGEDQSPMLSAALYQLGLDVGLALPEGSDMELGSTSYMTRYFHVPQALGSPYVPAQDGFVVPYNIQSVVGIGSGFVSRSLYILLGFSLLPLDKEHARFVAQMAPFIGATLASFDAKQLWE